MTAEGDVEMETKGAAMGGIDDVTNPIQREVAAGAGAQPVAAIGVLKLLTDAVSAEPAAVIGDRRWIRFYT